MLHRNVVQAGEGGQSHSNVVRQSNRPLMELGADLNISFISCATH
jgi:hypothetical protein